MDFFSFVSACTLAVLLSFFPFTLTCWNYVLLVMFLVIVQTMESSRLKVMAFTTFESHLLIRQVVSVSYCEGTLSATTLTDCPWPPLWICMSEHTVTPCNCNWRESQQHILRENASHWQCVKRKQQQNTFPGIIKIVLSYENIWNSYVFTQSTKKALLGLIWL